MHEALPKLEAVVLDALARDADVHPSALQFLLRRYQVTGSDELATAVGRGLAQALAVERDASVVDAASRLVLFVEAAALSEDERLIPAIEAMLAPLREAWVSPALVESTAAIGASLHAVNIGGVQSIAADAIDALEVAVGRVYRPGNGVGGGPGQIYAASALLAAYSVCGRLPYSMLAEELIQSARRDPEPEFVAACEAARVLCRLATLHDADDYRAAAVIAPDVDYRRDAAALLQRLAPRAVEHGTRGAIYGLALLELESTQSSLTND